jgi:glycosyltransferase involved in cell wall biosynthesis
VILHHEYHILPTKLLGTGAGIFKECRSPAKSFVLLALVMSQTIFYSDVSVLVAAHRGTSTLDACLRLLANQSFSGSWEVVLCDDGSNGDVLDLANPIFKNGPMDFRYVWQPRNGERRSHSRNNGLRCARGRIVILLDGDIAVGPEFVRNHVDAHRDTSNSKTAVYGTRKWIFDNQLSAFSSREEIARQVAVGAGPVVKLYSDFDYQQRFANTQYAWLGCFGCNLSFVREAEVFFDEQFLGWGSEDQEFACRLYLRHGYQLLFRPMIYGFHFEPGGIDDFCPVRPNTHPDIVQYLRNMLHFRDSYSELDMTLACVGAAYYVLNTETQLWERRHRPMFNRKYIHRMLETAAAEARK